MNQLGIKDKRMIDEKLERMQIPSTQLIEMIQQFINYLSYPRTKKIFQNQKQLKNNISTLIYQRNIQELDMIKQEQIEHNQQHNKIYYNNQHKQNNQSCEPDKLDSLKEDEKQLKNIWKERMLKYQQIKYLINFQNLEQKIQTLQSNCKNQTVLDPKLKQSILKSIDHDNYQESLKSKPALLYILSVSNIISKLKKFIIPVYRNLSIEPKFSKLTKFMSVSPKEHYLLTIDEQSTIILTNLKQKSAIKSQRNQSNQQITCVRWLNNGTSFAVGTTNGNIIIWNISKDTDVQKLKTLTPQSLTLNSETKLKYEITSIYCNKDYLYSGTSDFHITKIQLKTYKQNRIIEPRCTELIKLIKIQNKIYKNILFGIQKLKNQVVMIDQITGFSSVIFEINKNHGYQYKNYLQNKSNDGKYFWKYCWIQDLVVNHNNNCLIISIAGINPSIYEIDPQRNEIRLKLNYKNLKQSQPILQNFIKNNYQNKISNIHMSLSHKSEILVVTTNTRKIFFVRLKNWRILYEHKEMENQIKFGRVSASRRLCDFGERVENGQDEFSNHELDQINSETQSLKQRQSILCVENVSTGNIQLYQNEKIKLSVIKKQVPKQSRSISLPQNRLQIGVQGFLQMLQPYRQNYQGLI